MDIQVYSMLKSLEEAVQMCCVKGALWWSAILARLKTKGCDLYA